MASAMHAIRQAAALMSSSEPMERVNGVHMLHSVAQRPELRRAVGAEGLIPVLVKVLRESLEPGVYPTSESLSQLRAQGVGALLNCCIEPDNRARAVDTGAVELLLSLAAKRKEDVPADDQAGMASVAWAYGALWEIVKSPENIPRVCGCDTTSETEDGGTGTGATGVARDSLGFVIALQRDGGAGATNLHKIIDALVTYPMQSRSAFDDVLRRAVAMLGQLATTPGGQRAVVTTILDVWLDLPRYRRDAASGAAAGTVRLHALGEAGTPGGALSLFTVLIAAAYGNGSMPLHATGPLMTILGQSMLVHGDTHVRGHTCHWLHALAGHESNRRIIGDSGALVNVTDALREASARAAGMTPPDDDHKVVQCQALGTLVMATHTAKNQRRAVDAGVVPVVFRLVVMTTHDTVKAWSVGVLWNLAKCTAGAEAVAHCNPSALIAAPGPSDSSMSATDRDAAVLAALDEVLGDSGGASGSGSGGGSGAASSVGGNGGDGGGAATASGAAVHGAANRVPEEGPLSGAGIEAVLATVLTARAEQGDLRNRLMGLTHQLITTAARSREAWLLHVMRKLTRGPASVRGQVAVFTQSLLGSAVCSRLAKECPQLSEHVIKVMLKSSEHLVRVTGLRWLHALARHAECLGPLGSQGAVKGIIELLNAIRQGTGPASESDDRPPVADPAAAAASALADVAAGAAPGAAAPVIPGAAAGAGAGSAQQLSDQDKEVAEGVGALALMCSNEANEARAVVGGAYDVLLPLTHHATHPVRHNTLLALVKLAGHHGDALLAYGDGRAVDQIVAVGAGPHAAATNDCLLLLKSLLQTEVGQRLFMESVARLLSGGTEGSDIAEAMGGTPDSASGAAAAGATSAAAADDTASSAEHKGDESAATGATSDGADSGNASGASPASDARDSHTVGVGAPKPPASNVRAFVNRVLLATWGASEGTLSADSPIVKLMLSRLTSTDEQQLSDAFAWFHMLCKSDKLRTMLGDMGAIEPLAAALRRVVPRDGFAASRAQVGMLREGVAALLMATTTHANSRRAYDAGCVDALFALTKSDDDTVRRYAVGALWNVSRNAAVSVSDHGGEPGQGAGIVHLLNVGARTRERDTLGRLNGLFQQMLRAPSAQKVFVQRVRMLLTRDDAANDIIIGLDDAPIPGIDTDDSAEFADASASSAGAGGGDGEGEAETCSVCMDSFSAGDRARRLLCGHLYHRACVLPWLKSHDTCPLCRQFVEPSAERTTGFATGVVMHVVGLQPGSPLVAGLVEYVMTPNFVLQSVGCVMLHTLCRRPDALPVVGAGGGVEALVSGVRKASASDPSSETHDAWLRDPAGVPLLWRESVGGLLMAMKHARNRERALNCGAVGALWRFAGRDDVKSDPVLAWIVGCFQELCHELRARTMVVNHGGSGAGLQTLIEWTRPPGSHASAPSEARALSLVPHGMQRLVRTLMLLLQDDATVELATARYGDDLLNFACAMAPLLPTFTRSFVVAQCSTLATQLRNLMRERGPSVPTDSDRLTLRRFTSVSELNALSSIATRQPQGQLRLSLDKHTHLQVLSAGQLAVELMVRVADGGAVNVHPNISQFVSVSPSQGAAAMPAGMPLAYALPRPRGQQLSPWVELYKAPRRDAHFDQLLFDLAADIATGVKCLHQAGFVHNAICPDTVFLVTPRSREAHGIATAIGCAGDGARGSRRRSQAQLLGLGGALRAGYGTAHDVGRPGWRAPERAFQAPAGRPGGPLPQHLALAHLGKPSDVYSVGVVLAQLFGGIALVAPTRPPQHGQGDGAAGGAAGGGGGGAASGGGAATAVGGGRGGSGGGEGGGGGASAGGDASSGPGQLLVHVDFRPQLNVALSKWAAASPNTTGPVVVHSLLMRCMDPNPAARPSIDEVLSTLQRNRPVLPATCHEPLHTGGDCPVCVPTLEHNKFRYPPVHVEKTVAVCKKCQRAFVPSGAGSLPSTCASCHGPMAFTRWLMARDVLPSLQMQKPTSSVVVYWCSVCHAVQIAQPPDPSFPHVANCVTTTDPVKARGAIKLMMLRLSDTSLEELSSVLEAFSEDMTLCRDASHEPSDGADRREHGPAGSRDREGGGAGGDGESKGADGGGAAASDSLPRKLPRARQRAPDSLASNGSAADTENPTAAADPDRSDAAAARAADTDGSREESELRRRRGNGASDASGDDESRDRDSAGPRAGAGAGSNASGSRGGTDDGGAVKEHGSDDETDAARRMPAPLATDTPESLLLGLSQWQLGGWIGSLAVAFACGFAAARWLA